MINTDVRSETNVARPATMDMRLEVVILSVSDVDRAKRFYQNLGWRLDADSATGEADFRVVQPTPPGSAASVTFGALSTAAPGSADSLILVVQDIEAAHGDLVCRGVEVGEIFHEQSWLLQEVTRRLPGH